MFDYHPSKETYFSYLQFHKFISQNIKFEQIFRVENSTNDLAGSLNVFAIELGKLMGIENSVYLKGLKINLEFASPLGQAWKLVALYQYQGITRYRNMGEGVPPQIAFETVE